MQKVLARFAPQRLFAPPSDYVLRLLLVVLVNFTAAPTFATAQQVEIGKFALDGTVDLELRKFHQKFADGTRIAEITVTDHNGNRVVKRKGYSARSNCRIEIAPILSSTGDIIPSTSVASAGTPVFFGTLTPVTVFYCSDDHRRCALLKKLGNQAAYCDQTDASGNKCKCHVVPAEGGITIPSVDFWSWCC
jgi:hypothetical protein